MTNEALSMSCLYCLISHHVLRTTYTLSCGWGGRVGEEFWVKTVGGLLRRWDDESWTRFVRRVSGLLALLAWGVLFKWTEWKCFLLIRPDVTLLILHTSVILIHHLIHNFLHLIRCCSPLNFFSFYIVNSASSGNGACFVAPEEKTNFCSKERINKSFLISSLLKEADEFRI